MHQSFSCFVIVFVSVEPYDKGILLNHRSKAFGRHCLFPGLPYRQGLQQVSSLRASFDRVGLVLVHGKCDSDVKVDLKESEHYSESESRSEGK